MRARKMITGALLTLALGSGGVAAASAAYAQPAGCSANGVSFGTSSGGLTSVTTSRCTQVTQRTIVAEVKWDKNSAPDPLVAKNSSGGQLTNYRAMASACDNGNTRGYYARGYFTENTTYYDTAPQNVRAC